MIIDSLELDMEDLSCQENCTPSGQIERKSRRKSNTSHKGEVNKSDFFEGIPLAVDSDGAPMADSVSLMHEDASLLNASLKKRKDKMKKKRKKNQEGEATSLNNGIMSVNGSSCVSQNSSMSSEPVNESNISLANRKRKRKRKKKKKKEKEKQETEVTNPNNTNMPAEGPDSVLQILSENNEPVRKSKKKNKEKKQEEEEIEWHNSHNPAGANPALQELKEITDMMDDRLNKGRKKKKKRKRKQGVVNFNDSHATLEGSGPSLQELNVKTEPMAESNNSAGKKRRKKRQRTEDISCGDKGLNSVTEPAEMDIEYTSEHTLISGHQNNAVEGTTACLEKDQGLASPVQAAPATAFIEVSTLCLEEKAGFTDQCEGIITTSSMDAHDYKNSEVLQIAKQCSCQILVECLDTTNCNHEAEHPEHKIAGEESDIKNINITASEVMVSEGIVMETVKVDEPQPVLNSFINTSNPQISRKKLLILDLNGLLVDVVPCVSGGRKPDMILSRKYVFRRPFVDDFLKFCFERFAVAIWSSRTKKNIDPLIKFLFGYSRKKLVFRWNQCQCTRTNFKTIDNEDKPLLLKELRKVWEKLGPDLRFNKGEYNELNTLLLDDSPYKALCNPENTAIFPTSYQYDMRQDNSLGPGGDLRVYLQNLASAENIPEYVRQNPFGQGAITSSNPSWHFYEKVLQEVQRRNQRRARKTRWDR